MKTPFLNKKFLMISPFFSPNTGGVETFLDSLLNYLNRHLRYVDVITYQPLTTKINAPIVELKNNNKIYRIPWLKFNLFYKLERCPLLQLIYLGTGIGAFTFFYFLSGKGKAIITVNCHGLSTGFIGYILSFFINKIYVLNLYTNYRFSKKQLVGRFVQHMIRRYNRVSVLSEACKSNLVELGVPQNKIVSYHTWVDKRIYALEDKGLARKKLGWKEEGFYALFVGRFSKEKGIFDLLKAIPMLNEDINLVIIGGGIGENKVFETVNSNKNVFYLGRKREDELTLYFNAADILTYAPVDEDYLGRVAIAALSCGLPIMVPQESFYLGNKRKISIKIPSSIGVVFENNYHSLAQMLNDIHINRKEYPFNRIACREYAEKIYGEKINGKIVYDSLNERMKILS